MSRFHFRTAFITAGVLLPTTILAATFQGPSQTPPNGNVPGVIWNVVGTSASQYQAKINFGTPVSGVPYINALSDFGFTSGKALRVDVNGPSALNMGNWGGPGGSGKDLTFTIYGGERVMSIGANPILGQDGRVQADKFCFNPGNPSDCIMSGDTGNWLSGGGSGLYVLKAGDTMTGLLTASAGISTVGINISSNFKFQDSLGNRIESGAYQTPSPNQAFLEVKDTAGGKRLRLLPSGNNQLINGRVDYDAFPTAQGAWFEGVKAGQSNINVALAPSPGISASFNTNLAPGYPVQGYLGYCPPSSPCSGLKLTVQGSGNQGIDIVNPSGTSATIVTESAGVIGRATVAGGTGGNFTGSAFGGTFTGTDGTGRGLKATASGANAIAGEFFGGLYGVTSTGVEAGGVFTSTGNFGEGVIGLATSNGTGGEFHGGVYGVRADGWAGTGVITEGAGYGIVASSPLGEGGNFDGKTIGISAYSGTGMGADIIGNTIGAQIKANAGTGAVITGTGAGLSATASAGTGGVFSGTVYGINAAGAGNGSIFTGPAGYTTYLAYPGYGAYASVPTGAMGFRSVMASAANYGMYTNGAGYFGGAMSIAGEITASGNTLTSCVWMAYAAQSVCPAATPIMNGVRISGTSVAAYCCDL